MRRFLLQFAVFLLVVAGFWGILEFASWGILRTSIAVAVDQDSEQDELVTSLGTPFSHPLWSGFSSNKAARKTEFRGADLYDPLLSHRLAPLSDIDSNRGTDRYGFVHNGDPDREIDFGPDTVRIVLLGGSSMEGSKASSNERTIGGYLERQLNGSGDGRRYQVINAGVGGYYSQLEAIYFMTELIHYKPSVVVMLDGFNDFWHSWPPTQDSADRDGRAIPNRTNKQQEYLAFYSGEESGPSLIGALREPSLFTRVFHYSGELLASVVAKLFGPDSHQGLGVKVSASKDPWGQNSALLSEQVYGTKSHAPFMLANWKNVAGAASSHGIGAVLLLQPFIPVSSRTLTEVESDRYNTFLEQRAHLNPDEYKRHANAFYREARKGVEELKARTTGQPLVHVEDISEILNEQEEPMFMDAVHYTDQANEILASQIAAIVKRMIGGSSP